MMMKHIKTMSGDLVSLEVPETETVTAFYERVSDQFDVKKIQLQLFRSNEEDELKESDELLGGEEDEVFSAVMDKMNYIVAVNQITDRVYDLQRDDYIGERYEMYEVVLTRYGMESGPETVKQCLYVKPIHSPTDLVNYYLANRMIPSLKVGNGLDQERLIRIKDDVPMYHSFDVLMTRTPLGENLSDKRRAQLLDTIQTKWTELWMELFNAYSDEDDENEFYDEEDTQDSWS
jgi:hypothetical protein